MQTALNLATARTALAAYENPASSFVSRLNEATEQMMSWDLFDGTFEEVLFPISTDNTITLPRQFVALLGYDFRNIPRPIFSTQQQYQELGMGWRDPSKMQAAFGAIDAGYMVCSQYDVTGTVTLRIKINNVLDVGKVIHFSGLDADSQPIYSAGSEGFDFTTVSPQADTTQTVTAVTGIQIPVAMVGYWTLWQVDTNGVESLLGTYQPGDNYPRYRRYKIGERTAEEDNTVRCFCRRTHIPALVDTDWVYPGNIRALKFALKALRYEAAGNDSEASNAWAAARSILDEELGKLRGAEIPTLRIHGMGPPRVTRPVN